MDGKIRAGQLDEAPLTLREVGILKRQFEKVLAGLYHHRIDYPTTKHLTQAQAPGADGEGDGEVGDAGPATADPAQGEGGAGDSDPGGVEEDPSGPEGNGVPAEAGRLP